MAMTRNSLTRGLCALLLAATAVAADPGVDGTCVPLGELKAFWRNAPALGPYHEVGHRLIEIPDYLLKSDFPYPKKETEKEVPFADHLSTWCDCSAALMISPVSRRKG